MPGTRADNIITELATGSVVITRDLQYNNIRAEHVHVLAGVRARLFGTVNGKIILEKDAKLFVHGSFKGELINNGGRIYVFES